MNYAARQSAPNFRAGSGSAASEGSVKVAVDIFGPRAGWEIENEFRNVMRPSRCHY